MNGSRPNFVKKIGLGLVASIFRGIRLRSRPEQASQPSTTYEEPQDYETNVTNIVGIIRLQTEENSVKWSSPTFCSRNLGDGGV